MGVNTGIEWCQHSHNFWYGCRKVSPGCKLCYAERDMQRFGRDFNTVTKSKNFDAPLKWLKNGKAKPGDRIFVNSWSDFFIEEADPYRVNAWYIIEQTPQFNYLILTKRIERVVSIWKGNPFPDNIWIGVSVENQKMAAKKIPLLWEIKAQVRFVSFEPLLEPIQLEAIKGLTEIFYDQNGYKDWDYTLPFDWAIIGGESDYKNPRPMKSEWALDLIKSLEHAEVPIFFKQFGGSTKINGHWGGNNIDGRTWQEFPK